MPSRVPQVRFVWREERGTVPAPQILREDGAVPGVGCGLRVPPLFASVAPLETVVVEFTPQRQTQGELAVS